MATAPSSPISPLGVKQEEILEHFFSLLSQFAFDKAKELVEKERDAHKATFGSYWALMVHCLIQFASAEKSYMSLTFLEQKWFARSKDSLRQAYQVLVQEFHKVEEGVRQQELVGIRLPGPTVEFEKLLSHLCGQVCQFLTARQKTMDFYEQMSTMGTNKNLNYDDLVAVITEITQTHSKTFHHPLLSSLKNCFSLECEVINHLLSAQIQMSVWQFFPSIIQLHQAHTKLISWGASAQARESKKSAFGGSKTVIWPALYQWLLKFKCLLVSKFSLYFYDVLAKQTVPNEMKILTAKSTEDFVTRIISFQKKTDASNISLVLCTHGMEEGYTKPGYLHPGRQPNSPTGLDSYPAIFSYPGEHPVSHWPTVVMMINDRNTEFLIQEKVHYIYDKSKGSTYYLTKLDSRITLIVIFETKKAEKDSYVNNFMLELSSQIRGVKLFSSFKPGARGAMSRR
ncbi:hypothetical protein CHS0354_014856 [Potamilus streckersoni]|uniref:KICSTOR subunit 2 n=1 Tax=Potamilus streckersoni TaxID=2493646 RepID=A0AAE0VEL9_9BIVA|nr:hypothetical protein CHS0354_014856 [Potamilus streckersoni]